MRRKGRSLLSSASRVANRDCVSVSYINISTWNKLACHSDESPFRVEPYYQTRRSHTVVPNPKPQIELVDSIPPATVTVSTYLATLSHTTLPLSPLSDEGFR